MRVEHVEKHEVVDVGLVVGDEDDGALGAELFDVGQEGDCLVGDHDLIIKRLEKLMQ